MNDSNENSAVEKFDPFAPENIDKLRTSQNFEEAASVKAVITTVPVKKPHRQEFFRVRAGEEWRFTTPTFTDKEQRETFIVAPEIQPLLIGDVQSQVIYVCMSRNSRVPFLWCLSLPSLDGRSNRWWESGHDAAKLAEDSWIKLVPDMSSGSYVPHVANADLGEPEWPDLQMHELLRLGFLTRYIDREDHPIIKRLRGEV